LSGGQSKSGSALEAALNVTSGGAIAWALTMWVLPLWGYQYTIAQSVEITGMYAVVGWMRSYLWRRWFNREGAS